MSLRGKPDARTKRLERDLRKVALSFPDVREDHPWDHSAFKVKGKTFLFLGVDAEGLGMSVKLDVSHASALAKPFAQPTAYGLGKHGWVSARFAPGAKAPLDLLRRWIEESFYVIAPVSVLEKLEPASGRPARKRGSRAT